MIEEDRQEKDAELESLYIAYKMHIKCISNVWITAEMALKAQ